MSNRVLKSRRQLVTGKYGRGHASIVDHDQRSCEAFRPCLHFGSNVQPIRQGQGFNNSAVKFPFYHKLFHPVGRASARVLEAEKGNIDAYPPVCAPTAIALDSQSPGSYSAWDARGEIAFPKEEDGAELVTDAALDDIGRGSDRLRQLDAKQHAGWLCISSWKLVPN